MEGFITPDRIANAIMQDTDFRGVYVLVEGKKDMKMYRKFFSSEDAKLRQTWGKYSQRKVWEILTNRGYARKIAIRDADFLRIPGNAKFNANYAEAIFSTDFHDAEIVAIESNVLDAILPVTHDQEVLDPFQQKNGALKDVVKQMARPIGLLKLANKRESLGLSFKPQKAEGNRLKYHKFVDVERLVIDIDKMINTVWEFSRNRGQEVKSPEKIKATYSLYASMNFPLTDLINGHDFSEIICLISTKMLKCTSKVFSDSDTVEEALAIGFTRDHFGRTSLFNSIDNWQRENCAPIVIVP